MATYTLDQPVRLDDLILVFHSTKRAHMLLVKALKTNDTHPTASSIVVEETHMQIPSESGSWSLDGPDVYYTKEDEPDSDCISAPSTPPAFQLTLDDILFNMRDNDAGENDSEKDSYPGVDVIVNPHGRDVLKHYFRYQCPECQGRGWICPGCGIWDIWPEIAGSCGLDQSCPVCMGYDFAYDDGCHLRELDDLEAPRKRYRGKPGDPSVSPERYQELFEEYLSSHRLRYECINSRREEMGIDPISPEELQRMEKSETESWFGE